MRSYTESTGQNNLSFPRTSVPTAVIQWANFNSVVPGLGTAQLPVSPCLFKLREAL